MDTVLAPAPSQAAPAIPRLGGGARVGYALGGLLLLAFMTLFSLGTALLAPLVIGVGTLIARMRGGRLSPLVSWVVAVTVTAALLGIAATVLLLSLPEGTLEEAVRQAQAAPPPEQPEWLERLNPGGAQQNPQMTVSTMITGIAMACVMLGAWGGTGGWAATLLIAAALTGRPIRGGR